MQEAYVMGKTFFFTEHLKKQVYETLISDGIFNRNIFFLFCIMQFGCSY